MGVFGRRGTRNVPALINRGYGRAFFWDGRSTSLEEQVLHPIQDPNEMGLTLEVARARLRLNETAIARALASYVRSIRSGDSRFDRYASGRADALTDEEKKGLQIFRGKGNCTACHVGPNFTDELFHNTGVAWRNGAFADEGSVARGARSGVDARTALRRNDSHGFFCAEGGVFRTGPTGSNVMDLALLRVEPDGRGAPRAGE